MPPKKGGANKTKYSRWLITVDPRRKPGSYPGGEAGLRRNLQLCARLLSPPHIQKFVYLMPKGHTYEKNILQTTADHAIEKGEKRGFIHLHALVSVKHTSSVRLSYPVFRAACEKILGGKCHFDAKLARGGESLEDIKRYIHKQGAKKDEGEELGVE